MSERSDDMESHIPLDGAAAPREAFEVRERLRLARLGNPRLLARAAHGLNPDPHPMA